VARARQETYAELMDFSKARLPLFSTATDTEVWQQLELADLELERVEGLIDRQQVSSEGLSALRDLKNEIAGTLLHRNVKSANH